MSGAASYEPLLSLLLPLAIWSGAVAAIAISMAWHRAPRPQTLYRRSLARSIGLATYPLYLVHAELGIALMLILEPLGAFWALLISLALVLAAVALIMQLEALIRSGLRLFLARARSVRAC